MVYDILDAFSRDPRATTQTQRFPDALFKNWPTSFIIYLKVGQLAHILYPITRGRTSLSTSNIIFFKIY